uniref:Uncharacterized protein n=1 Tax=Loxodonta africana TaxID=9785 RepID=G3U2K1_LOXAF
HISSSVAATNKLMLSSNPIATVISVSVKVVDTLCACAKAPVLCLSDFAEPIADPVCDVETKQDHSLTTSTKWRRSYPLSRLPHEVPVETLLDAHAWTKSCRQNFRPLNGFREQLILYEFQLFGKNRVQTVSSRTGLIPDVYEKEARFVTLPGTVSPAR